MGQAKAGERWYHPMVAKLDAPLAYVLLLLPTVLLVTQLYSSATTHTTSVREFLREACPSGKCQLRVPRIIHQTYKTRTLPALWEATPALWQQKHPGWQYEFWDDARNRRFIAENYSWFLPQFDAYPNNIQRADAIRYFILYHYGGVYADLDIQPLRNIEPMLGEATTVLPVTPNLGLTNAFMASSRHNEFMLHVTQQLPLHARRWFHVFRHWQILTSTGPTFLWKVADAYAGPEPILRVPASVWGKCMICLPTCPTVPEGFLQHLHGDSWHNWDSWLFTYVIFCHYYTVVFLVLLSVILLAYRGASLPWLLAHRELALYATAVFCILMMFQGQ